MTFEEAWQESILKSKPEDQCFVDDITKHKEIIKSFFNLGVAQGYYNGQQTIIKDSTQIQTGEKHEFNKG